MIIDVALTPRDLAGRDLSRSCALVVDVFRASTSIVTAFDNGCDRIVPVATPDAARERGRALGAEALLAGERNGERIAGFDLGNSPLEYGAARVRGRALVFTTTNGTRALLAVPAAAEIGIAALVNLDAAARWAAAHSGDLVVVCAGERDALALEDTVCAGLLVQRVEALRSGSSLTDAALVAYSVGRQYAHDLDRLRADAAWARRLARTGYAADLTACLAVGTSDQVPRMVDGALVRLHNGAAPFAPGGCA